MAKRCAVCGEEKDLQFYINVTVKTKGNPVTIPKCYICKKCNGRIIPPYVG